MWPEMRQISWWSTCLIQGKESATDLILEKAFDHREWNKKLDPGAMEGELAEGGG